MQMFACEDKQSWAELTRLQQVHFIKCKKFFKPVKQDMLENYRLSKLAQAREDALELQLGENAALRINT
jgi:hypothetical protein